MKSDRKQTNPKLKYRRILLKLSGEALGNEREPIDLDIMQHYAREVARLVELGCEVAVVFGGGNIYRGGDYAKRGVKQREGDYAGMLATVINAKTFESQLVELIGTPEESGVRVTSATTADDAAERFIMKRFLRHLEKGRVVLLAGGTGMPFFTTDTGAAVYARIMEPDLVIISKNGVKGVYSDDPKTNPKAKFYPTLSYRKVIRRQLKVMDRMALPLCEDGGLLLNVCNASEPGTLERIVRGERIGTLIHN